jgi:SAM-dependent methyltransferase
MHTPTQIHYNENASHYALEYQGADVADLHGILGKWLPNGCRVLEIGSGIGRDAAYMASLGCRVIASDASNEMLRFSEEYLQTNSQNDSYDLVPATFPLEPGHKLLSERFDAVVCLATIMHIPDSDLFTFAFQIKTLLNTKGIFICSFCPGREVSEEDPRLFVNREPSQIQLFFERIGFRLLYAEENRDGMGRDIQWTTLVFESEGVLGFRPVDQIEAIINRDKKVATYKLALVRALCDISQTEYRNAKWHANNTVSIPLGLIAEKWLYYYWPLIESEIILPQMNGSEKTKQIAFRGQLTRLVAFYHNKGGLSAFNADYRSGKLISSSQELFLECIKAISNAIVKGPINYAGGSIEGRDQIFIFYGNLGVSKIKTRDDVSSKLGRVYFDASIWREMGTMRRI